MEREYVPETFETELERLLKLIQVVHIRRMKDRPFLKIEDIIRQRKVSIYHMVAKSKTARIRLAKFTALKQRKTQELLKQLKFPSSKAKDEFVKTTVLSVRNTSDELRLIPLNITAPTEYIKSQLSSDSPTDSHPDLYKEITHKLQQEVRSGVH